MVPIGMVFFVFCYALVLSLEYAQTERAMVDARANEQHLASENAALDRVDRLKTELIATISHEARTPLAVLSSYAGLVAMELKDKGMDAQITADLDTIVFEAKRVANLIDGMKSLTLYSEETARRVCLDLPEIIRQTAGLYQHMFDRRKVSFTLQLEEQLPPIFGSPEGSGLGLAICREVIESHGGVIEIKSELDKGTAVAFTLPIYTEDMEDAT